MKPLVAPGGGRSGRRLLFSRLLAVLLSNALVAFLLVTGRIDPLSLLVLVALDGAVLGAVQAVQELRVPRAALPAARRRSAPLMLLQALIFAVAIVFVDAFVLWAMSHVTDPFWDFLRRPFTLAQLAGLVWPLAITLAVAVLDARRDARRWAASGGEFQSTPGENAAARWFALVLGALPHAMPLLTLVAVGGGYFRRREERLGAAAATSPISRWALIGLAASCVAIFALVRWLLGSGLAGWSVAFCIGKFSSEALVLVVPERSPGSPASSPVPGEA